MIKGKIDVTKIDKSRLFKGKKGTYLDFIMIPTPESEYGDYMIKEDVPYEQRKEGIQGNILGNARIVEKKAGGWNDGYRGDDYMSKDPDQGPDELPF